MFLLFLFFNGLPLIGTSRLNHCVPVKSPSDDPEALSRAGDGEEELHHFTEECVAPWWSHSRSSGSAVFVCLFTDKQTSLRSNNNNRSELWNQLAGYHMIRRMFVTGGV